jgi:secreted PhoX family phosphatase
VFSCPVEATSLVPARPLRGYGRFRHEAVAVDPRTNVAYLTEDQSDGCLYRFVPSRREQPFSGKLQALRAVNAPNYDTSERMAQDRAVRIDWVDVSNPDPDEDSVRAEARAAGALRVCRGEGIAFHDGELVFTATSGGSAGRGQIFRLRDAPEGVATSPAPSSRDTGPRLELIAEANESTPIDGPDNVTVAPWGEVFFAEDGSGNQFIRAVGADGRVRDVARNARSASELSGVCFSPDGSTLFFNLQRDGLTVAVRGPWSRA